jgi:hypothetical protein
MHERAGSRNPRGQAPGKPVCRNRESMTIPGVCYGRASGVSEYYSRHYLTVPGGIGRPGGTGPYAGRPVPSPAEKSYQMTGRMLTFRYWASPGWISGNAS